MTTPLTDDERQLVTILAFASREFDRVRDLLVRDDEPGAQEVAGEDGDRKNAKKDDEGKEDGGLVHTLLGVAGAVASTAGRLVVGSVHPQAQGWEKASLDDRIDWWTKRFGTAAAALAAVPGLGGKLGKMVGLGSVVGASAQVLVVNAVAQEMGEDDLAERVAAAARIVLGHELDPAAVETVVDAPEAQPEADVPGDSDEEKQGPLARVGRTAALVWRVAKRVHALRSDLDERQQGGFLSRALSNLPGVGAVGAFVSERSGISQAADKAREEFSS